MKKFLLTLTCALAMFTGARAADIVEDFTTATWLPTAEKADDVIKSTTTDITYTFQNAKKGTYSGSSYLQLSGKNFTSSMSFSLPINCKAITMKTGKNASTNVTVALYGNGAEIKSGLKLATKDANFTFEIPEADQAKGTVYEIKVTNKYNAQFQSITYVEATVPGLEYAATPTFTPGAGTVEAGTKVSIACATEGAKIYYTVDGSAPTTASTIYAEPITINQTTTVKAIAVKEGMENSGVASATYTVPAAVENIKAFIALADKTNPTLVKSNAKAVFQKGNSLVMTDGSAWILVYGATGQTYVNGDVIPGGYSGRYELFGQDNTTKEGGYPEIVSPAGFTKGANEGEIKPVETTIDDFNAEPMLSYVEIKNVDVTGSGRDFTATNPQDQTTTAALYDQFQLGNIATGTNMTVRGFVSNYRGKWQIMVTEVVNAQGLEAVATPTFSVAAGEVTAGTEVAIKCATEGAVVYYTIDGTNPTADSKVYSAPIVINEETTIKAIAVKEGLADSNVATATYTVKVIAENQAMFNFNDPSTLNPSYTKADATTDSNKSIVVTGTPFTKGNVTVTATKGSVDAKLWWKNDTDVNYRVYKGATLTIASTDPSNTITGIEIKTEAGTIVLAEGSAGTYENGKWSDTAGAVKVDFSITANAQINTIEVTCQKKLSGVENVTVEDENAPVEFYNLQGIRVNNPENGIFIRRQGSKVTKVIIK